MFCPKVICRTDYMNGRAVDPVEYAAKFLHKLLNHRFYITFLTLS